MIDRSRWAMRGYARDPSSPSIEVVRLEYLSKQLKDIIAELNKLISEDVANLNKQLRDSGLQFLNPGNAVEPPPQ